MQGLYAQFSVGSICLPYTCIVLDLAVDVAVYKASVLNWPRQVSIRLLYICIILDLAVGVMLCNASMLNLTGGARSSSGCTSMQGLYAQLSGGSICLLYICIVLDLAVGALLCNASMLNWLGGLDIAVGVVVCKASMLNCLGDPSVFHIYALY